MITRRMDYKLEQLKAYFNTKFKEQEEKFTKTFHIIDNLKKPSFKMVLELEQYGRCLCLRVDDIPAVMNHVMT